MSWYISVCENMGIKVLPPNVNASEAGFAVDGKAIRFGMGGIKSVGDIAVDSIIKEREKHGFYKDFFDFTKRVDSTKVNKRVVENLIKSGSLDSFGAKRSQLLAVMDNALELAAARQNDLASGQIGLFGEEEVETMDSMMLPNVPELPTLELLRLEKELIGFYVTGHPLDAYRETLQHLTPLSKLNEENFRDGMQVTVGGIISDNKLRTTKNGDRMANFILEDFTGSLNVIAFPKCYNGSANEIKDDNLVKISGIVKLDEETPRIFANFVEKLAKIKPEVHIFIDKDHDTKEKQQELGKIFAQYPGDNPVFLHLTASGRVIKTNARFWVNKEITGFAEAIKGLLGDKAIK